MNENEKVMNDTAKAVIKMLHARLNSRLEASKAFEPGIMESLPDTVKISREQDASKLRAVIQEQKDLIDILTMMFPNA